MKITNSGEQRKFQNNVNSIMEWSSWWVWAFNTDKCKVLTVTNKQNSTNFTYSMDKVDLETINEAKYLGIKNLSKKYNISDMVRGDVIFCATGVTDGDIVKGIKDRGDSFESETFVLHKSSKTNKKIKNINKK